MNTIFVIYEIRQRRGSDRETPLGWLQEETAALVETERLNERETRDDVYFEVRSLERYARDER